MPGLFISCPVTQNKGRITIPLCEAQMNTFRVLNHSVNSASAGCCGLKTLSCGFTVGDNNPPSWLVALFFFFLEQQKQMMSRSVCVAERGGEKKRLSFIIQMK